MTSQSSDESRHITLETFASHPCYLLATQLSHDIRVDGSIAALFVAGYLPGIFIGLILMVTAAVFIKKEKLPPGDGVSLKEFGKTFLRAFPSLMLLVVVIGGIVGGIFTATEASAIAVIYTLALSFYYKELKIKDFHDIELNYPCLKNGKCKFNKQNLND